MQKLFNLCNIKYYHNSSLSHISEGFHNAVETSNQNRIRRGSIRYTNLYMVMRLVFGDEIHSDLKHSKRRNIAMASIATGERRI